MIAPNPLHDPAPAYLVFDAESVPDGRLLNAVKYPRETLTPEEAVARVQAERQAQTGSDFVPVTFQLPVAICALAVGADFRPQALLCLDAPHYRPRQIAEQFWAGLVGCRQGDRAGLQLVTYNGRGFDLPLLEMAAFRYGICGKGLFAGGRKRYDGWHLDLMDWLTNHGDFRPAGGLNLLSKLLGKPGKMEVTGNKVYQLYRAGDLQRINDYCMFDTLDTYFVFLRTRVLAGELSLDDERATVHAARAWLARQTDTWPALAEYLTNCGDWSPWP